VPEPRPAKPTNAEDVEALRVRAERAEREGAALRQEHDRLHRENERLRRENDRLRHEVDAARRAGFRQAAPFSKGPPARHPRRPGRKPGAAYGHAAHRPTPTRIDETYTAPIPRRCPRCAGPLIETAVATQYQEELPPVQPIVRAFHVHIGQCQQCGRRVQGRHPLQTSDALGAAAAQVGPRATATAAVLHIQFGVPFGKIAAFYQQHFGLTVTAGGLVHALHRTARQATPTYAALIQTVRHALVVVPDETGWKVGAQLQWLWVFATATTTVYAILPGRGFDQAKTILGEDFAGVLVRDGWAPYRRFTAAIWQSCLNHLLGHCRTLQLQHPHSPFAAQVAAVLTQALALRDRRDAGTVSAHGVAVARGHLWNRLNRLVDTHSVVPAVQRVATHVARELPGVFTFLLDPAIDATNWRAEQAIRPAVVTRKVCGGNRTEHGAHTQSVLATVLRTSTQRHLDPLPILTDLLHAAAPRLSGALCAPT
jgi:transposase